MMQKEERVKIGHTYRGDFIILQQEMEDAINKTMQALEKQEENIPNSNFKTLRPAIERRMQQFFLIVSSKFRNVVEYTTSNDKEMQKVIMKPDENLFKINQVKTSMLKESILANTRQKWPEVSIPFNLRGPSQIEIVHCQEYKESDKSIVNRMLEELPDHTQDVKRIEEFEQLAAITVQKIELQQQLDRQFLSALF